MSDSIVNDTVQCCIVTVMEYIPRGELFAAWKHCECFSENLVKIYIAELAMVIDFLHRAGIIYRDLKVYICKVSAVLVFIVCLIVCWAAFLLSM